MRRHAKAPSAGSNTASGNAGRRFRRALAARDAAGDSKGSGAPSHRRTPVALLAPLASAFTVLALTLVFGAGLACAATPTLTINPTVTPGYRSVEFSGEVDPNGDAVEWFSEFSTDGGATWQFGGGLGYSEEDAPQLITNAVQGGLDFATTYKIRLGAFDYTTEELSASAEPSPEFTTKPEPAPPTVVLDPITDHTGSTAIFSGNVETNAPAGPLTDEAKALMKASWHFECNPACANLTPAGGAGSVEASEASKAVTAEATNLEPNVNYEVRLVAGNAVGSDTAGPEIVQTPEVLPTVTITPGASDGQGGFTLQGVVNAHNSNVTCTFEYGPNVPYAFLAPCSPDPSGFNHNRPVTVEAHLTGLTVGATYHGRLVVTNSKGPVSSADQIFEPTRAPTQSCPNDALRAENSSLALPECRAYEMISYPEKAGFPAAPWGLGESASPITVGYSAGAGNIARSGQGDTGQNYYVARRTVNGWETIPDLNGPDGSLFSGPQALRYPLARPYFYSGNLLTSLWNIEPNENSFNHRRPWLRIPDGSFSALGEELFGEDGGEFSASDGNDHFSLDLTHLLFDGTSGGFGEHPYGPGVYEYVGTGNGAPTRVDLDNLGDPISGCGAESPSERVANNVGISADGRAAVFIVNGSSLCDSSEGPPADEIWARVGGSGGAAYDVSESLCTRTAGDPGGACNAPSDPTFVGVASDGSRVLFTTRQQLVNGDTDQTKDLYACDMLSSTPAAGKRGNPCAQLTEVSGAASGANVDRIFTTSEDGSTAYFTSKAVLATNEDALDETAKGGENNLYVWRQDVSHPDGETSFLGALENPGDAAEHFNPKYGIRHREFPQTTDDGRYFVFCTKDRLVPTDTDESRDVYRYDAETGEMSRVSVNSLGIGGNANFNAEITSQINPFQNTAASQSLAAYPHPSVANDGTVVFVTPEALSPVDGNEAPDAYLWRKGKTSLITTASVGSMEPLFGRNDNWVFIDKSGEDVFFTTPQPLVAGDSDEVPDLYDARIGGGFKPGVKLACSGEACQPAPSAPPAAPNPATSVGGSEGNVKPKHCGKGKVLSKGKCVRKKVKAQHHKKGKKGKSKGAASGGGAK